MESKLFTQIQTLSETVRNPRMFFIWKKIHRLCTLIFHWHLGTAHEDLQRNHSTSTPLRSETNGIAERAVRRFKEGTSIVLLQSGLDEQTVGRCYGVLWLLTQCSRPVSRCESSIRTAIGEPFSGPIIPFGAKIEHHPISTNDQARLHQFGKKVLSGIVLWATLFARWMLEKRHTRWRR